jgi:hypothetical protein
MASPVRRATNDGCGRAPWPALTSWSRLPFGHPEVPEGVAGAPRHKRRMWPRTVASLDLVE